MRRFCTVALAIAGVALAAIAIAADEPTTAGDPPAASSAATPAVEPQLSAAELTERVRKSVVVVMSAGRDPGRDGLGSGFIVSSDGLVVTNHHVIGEGRGIRVQLADGRQFEAAAIHASDRALDLAVLRIEAKDLVALELGDSDALKQGQAVLALGNPQGLKNSVVAGLVSGVREMEGRPMIQLAIPIEPGNSGGPLVDMQGRVQGVLTMKSLVTPNLGFALTVNLVKPLLAKPNPIPMSRWLTIGALDPREWTTLFGARWRQRAGRITVDGLGQGFGGRSLCLAEQAVPEGAHELSVTVQLNDESGAAGLAFCSDGGDRHYGFYPTAGRLRLTRFDGPDVNSWRILHDEPNRHYKPREWNTLRVRLDGGKILCFINDQPVVELAESQLTGSKAGLVKFRQTQAQFKEFRLGREVPRSTIVPERARHVAELAESLPADGSFEPALVEKIAAVDARAGQVLRERAQGLDKQAAQLRALAQAAHEQRVRAALVETLAGPEEKIDLFRAGLLVALLDNEEVDVDAYREELERMGRELAAKVPEGANDAARLAALRGYLFEENGFHGSRGDFYNRSNSYLNEVLDDREGLPITLSVVYLELARRIGLNVVGVGLPGHFVVRHVPAAGEGQLIDVYEGAEIVERAKAAQRVKQASGRDVTEADLAPVNKRAIVLRMLGNLLGTSGNDTSAMHRYLNALLSLDAEHAQYHFLRAIVRYRLDQRDAALEDVAWLLDHRPEGIDFDRVRELQQTLQREP